MSAQKAADVLVVGAGPVGLYAALKLARGGASVCIVEREKRTKLHSYALALHAGTLRALQADGLADGLLSRGHRIDSIAFYDHTDRRAELSLSAIRGDFPYLLVLPQSELEYTLLRGLSNAGVRPLWNHELIEFHDGPGGVTVELAEIEEITQGYPIMRTCRMRSRATTLKAGFVIGADGHHSLVRRLIHASFEARSHPQTFVVFEFFAENGTENEARVVLDGSSSNVLWPMGEHRYRWTLEITGSATPTREEDVLDLIRSRAPWFQSAPGESTWFTTVQFDQRLASRLGAGRIWLAGDAAHSTGPIGAQSMNAGLLEADCLANVVLQARQHQAAVPRPDEYQAGCRRMWQRLHDHDPGVGRTWVNDWVRGNADRLIGCIPATGDDLESLLDQLRP